MRKGLKSAGWYVAIIWALAALVVGVGAVCAVAGKDPWDLAGWEELIGVFLGIGLWFGGLLLADEASSRGTEVRRLRERVLDLQGKMERRRAAEAKSGPGGHVP